MDTHALLPKLIALITRLQTESAGFLEDHQDSQQWYNRGYAAGMVEALEGLGYADALQDGVARDPTDLLDAHGVMSWGKAYRHGYEIGHRETLEVLTPQGTAGHALS